MDQSTLTLLPIPADLYGELPEFYRAKSFVKVIQEANLEKKLCNYQFIQLVPLNFYRTYCSSKFFYDVSELSSQSKELFERALNEAKSISQFHPETSPVFIRPEQEKHFCNLLMNQKTDAWKEYVCHKIYQACKLFGDVEIKRFVAEFADDGFGNFWLVDVKIYDITFSGIEGF